VNDREVGDLYVPMKVKSKTSQNEAMTNAPMVSHMYAENRKTINWFVGCVHNCIYCKPSFQRQMKRQKHNCPRCYHYEPHAHLERLLKSPPKTFGDEFVFFPSSGDIAFASLNELNSSLDYVHKYPSTTFLMQSKDPFCFLLKRNFPNNLILGTTIETNKTLFAKTPSEFKSYQQISNAPILEKRYLAMLHIQHNRKLVTIEPILDFDLEILVLWIKEIEPEIVYVGYDNHNCRLPEPPLAKTKQLIAELQKFTEVRTKTLRKAWYEK